MGTDYSMLIKLGHCGAFATKIKSTKISTRYISKTLLDCDLVINHETFDMRILSFALSLFALLNCLSIPGGFLAYLS